ncbi:uncharacterized protein LOC143735256 isoform X1 [Siphateles boraxobius]|uniref:uncharacterized protein LOC143735256 isoform X1 n=1 Tax=Siphateles boraxobius TaxID=180520 RepID=UPI004063B317
MLTQPRHKDRSRSYSFPTRLNYSPHCSQVIFKHILSGWKKMIKEKTSFFFWLCFCLLNGVSGGDAVKSVMEGDSVTLNTGVTEIKKDDVIEWRFGTDGSLLARINRELDEIYISNYADERFRDRLKLDDQTGSLTIMNTRTSDSGLYEVIIRGKNTKFNVTVDATTTPDPPSTSHPTSASSSRPSGSSSRPSGSSSRPSGSSSRPSGSSSRPSGSSSGPSGSPDSVSLIVLISAAAAGSLMLIAVVVIFFIYRKHRKTDQQAEASEEEITYADPTFYKRNPPKTQEDEVVYAAVVPRR